MRSDKLIATGKWGDTVEYELYLSNTPPPPELCTAVGCVALTGPNYDQIVLTHNQRGWEIIGGHLEPGESPEEALKREALEEGGFHIASSRLFGYRKIHALTKPAPGDRAASYPYPLTFFPFYVCFTDRQIGRFTGEEIIDSKTFTPQERNDLVMSGQLREQDELIIKLGIEASLLLI